MAIDFSFLPPTEEVLKSELVLSIQESPETCLAMEHTHVKRSSIPRLDSRSVTNKTWQMYQFHRVPILFMMILKLTNIWIWVNTYRYIFSGMNIHLPAILMFTRGTMYKVLTHCHMMQIA